jgi:hypothetical protein
LRTSANSSSTAIAPTMVRGVSENVGSFGPRHRGSAQAA